MNAAISQVELEQQVLIALYDHSQKGDQSISAADIQSLLTEEFGKQRIELALRALASAALVVGSYPMNRPAKYSISEIGYKQVEDAFFVRLKAAEEEQAESDPIESLERQIVPAAGRMVSFGDNQVSKGQAIETVTAAEGIIRSSNVLPTELREETVASLEAWKSLASSANSFAVGAFRFLVWDRIKKVIEGGIEEAYRLTLAGLLITLGTIIVGLL